MTQKSRENPAPRSAGNATPPSSPSADQRKRADLRVVEASRDVSNDLENELEEGLEETFPGSDPVSATRRSTRHE